MESIKYDYSMYSDEYAGYESNEYLESCIQNRNKEITKLYKEISKRHEQIDLLKSYNHRDRETIEENNRQEMELIKSNVLTTLNISETDDLRGVLILFNKSLEYIDTLNTSEFFESIKDDEVYKNCDTPLDAVEQFLRKEKLYANSAKYFIEKPLKWYKKPFRDMILSFSGWKVDENGMLTDVEW